ncbi:unnamed protein product, partial [Brachionus calyciflorus]
CSTDEGSAFVRLFKTKYIPESEIYSNEETADKTLENCEIIEEEINNEEIDEYNQNGILPKINTIEEERNEYDINLQQEEIYEFTELDELNLYTEEPILNLSIKIGSDDIARFSCACHKNKIAVRMSIRKNRSLENLLTTLSRYAARNKNSINNSKYFIQKKARLRIENTTRWSSSFLMLESFHNALKKNAFPPDEPCPALLIEIELYMQILLPAFQFNLIMQKSKSTIADVLPTLQIMISKWNRMKVSGNYRKLCDSLISSFKYKFDYELNSSIYAVASLINVSKLKLWISRPDCKLIRRRAIDDILVIGRSFVGMKMRSEEAQSDELNRTVESTTSTMDSMAGMLRYDDYVSETEIMKEIDIHQLEKEKLIFLRIVIDESNFDTNSSARFWNKFKKDVPFLGKLAIILLNIPSSSAYIERFYSICGAICKQNCGDMRKNTIIMRSVLKANIDLIENIKI